VSATLKARKISRIGKSSAQYQDEKKGHFALFGTFGNVNSVTVTARAFSSLLVRKAG
jgi:hypothetical protein